MWVESSLPKIILLLKNCFSRTLIEHGAISLGKTAEISSETWT